MKKLKEIIFEYILHHQHARKTRFPHFDQPMNVLVVYESDMLEHNDAVKSVQQDMRRHGMNVSLWGYAPKRNKDITSPVLPQSRIVGLDDYNLFGKLKSETEEALRANRYHILFDLSTHPLLPLRYLALYADADFKAGLNMGEGIHDMLIAPSNLDTEQARPEVTWLYNQMIDFLAKIKSND